MTSKISASVEGGYTLTTPRAIVVYVEDEPHLIGQVLCLRQSWLYTHSPDTDLVVMGTANALARLPDDLVNSRSRRAHQFADAFPTRTGCQPAKMRRRQANV